MSRRGPLRGLAHAWTEGGPFLTGARLARRAAEALQRGAEALEVTGAARAVGRLRRAPLDEALDFAERFEYGEISIRPMQIRSEIRRFLELVAADPPRAVLEIGTGRGGTLFLLGHVAAEDACLVSLEAPDAGGSFAGRASFSRRGRLYRALGGSKQRVVFLAADSHSGGTRTRVEEILGGRRLELLFIDGDHTREGVEADFKMYSPLVRSGGLVAFHDIVPGSPEAVGGVPAFWHELRDRECLEFVEDWNQGCCGIGVLRV